VRYGKLSVSFRRKCYPKRMQCEACRNDLEPNTPIYRVALHYSHPWVGRKCPGCIIRVCAACLPGFPDIREWSPQSPCIHCGRPIIASRNRQPPKLFCCSTECDAATRNAAARRKRGSRRAKRSCQGCGKPFEPKRTDAKFCSLVCKQRTFRQRLVTKAKGLGRGLAGRSGCGGNG